jgi:hypothetical protein
MREIYYCRRAARHFKENMLPVPDDFEDKAKVNKKK